jgi:hypothetical protein
MRGTYETDEPLKSDRERELRAGERVSLDGRVGVLRYLYGTGAAVVRFDREAGTKVVPLRRLVACTEPKRRPDSAEPLLPDRDLGEEVCMAETPGAKFTVTFLGIEVTATKDRLWHAEAAGRSASAHFLDQALYLVLPRLSYEDLDRLLIRLLSATATEQTH